jgi:nucleoside-diphosphate-sugar epimerase
MKTNKTVLILGVNGFIGNCLTKSILANTNWEIYGTDINDNKLQHSINNPRLHFTKGDITKNKAWVTEHIKKCDTVLPLVAIATPATYVADPLSVFELDFEANLEIVRQCVQYKKRIIFPSTSEVYGMCPEKEFDEETSVLVQGPINKERWIYSCSKQMMDRVIYAYGNHGDLKYTLFRPFNWIGPTQDDIHHLPKGGVRVVTQFISNIFYGKDFHIVDGGKQRRCFTYIDDAITALLEIVANPNNCADKQIFNIGNPKNNFSIKDVAEKVLKLAADFPKYREVAKKLKIIDTPSATYYGKGYQDLQNRVPAIKKAETILHWSPTTDLDTALRKTMEFYLQ